MTLPPAAPLHEIIRLMHSLTLEEIMVVQLTANREISQRQQLEALQHGDNRRDELRTQIKSFISSRGSMLKGPQLALIACHYLTLSGAETFPSRLVGSQIEEWTESRPSNITSVMDTLKERKQVEVHGEDGAGNHKTYSLTDSGRAEAERQVRSIADLEKPA